jgi:hypothetical protein
VGNYITYSFVEEDGGGSPQTVTITNPDGGTITFELEEADVDMGYKSVYFNDPDTKYYLSYIHFMSRQQ